MIKTHTPTAKLPDYMFVSSIDGTLSDTRKANWHHAPLRQNYCRTHREIKTLADLKATIRNGGFAWPGGYPMFFITHDSAALCFDCARTQFRQIVWDYMNKCSTGWRVVACDINYEDNDCFCAHCNEQIESAYGEVKAS